MLEENGRLNSKIKQELLDMDYIDKLNEEEKKFLNNFLEETVNANFKHKGKIFIKAKKKQLEIYRENNARNRCVYNIAKITGRLKHEDYNTKINENKEENEIINNIEKREDNT